MNLFRRHSLEYTLSHLQADEKRQLKRTLSWFDVAMLGVSMSVGAGIFSVGAKVIVNQAGPAAIISFLIAAFVCALAAMCYAEFASSIPIAGSAYTFSYASLGEVVAWMIGWNLILELFMAVAVIIKYWSIYLYTAFSLIGVNLPGPIVLGSLKIDWPIFIGIAIFTLLLVYGAKLSAKVATVFVFIKVGVIFIIIIAGLRFFDIANFSPFIPEAQTGANSGINTWEQSLLSFVLGQQPQTYGVFGIFVGAAVIFFAFIGFDNAATAAEETINPRKNVPIGLLTGIGVVSVLYIAVAIVTAGMVNREEFAQWFTTHPDAELSLATAFQIRGENVFGALISFGAFIGLTTVVIISMLGLSRIVFAMSRDGLMPRAMSITSKHNTPARIQIGASVLIALIAAFVKIESLAEMINIGTLSAFIIVSFAVPRLRKHHPNQSADTFKVPLSPFIPILSGAICIWLSLNLAVATWIMFAIWLAIGLTFYLAYGRKHSELEKHPEYCA